MYSAYISLFCAVLQLVASDWGIFTTKRGTLTLILLTRFVLMKHLFSLANPTGDIFGRRAARNGDVRRCLVSRMLARTCAAAFDKATRPCKPVPLYTDGLADLLHTAVELEPSAIVASLEN